MDLLHFTCATKYLASFAVVKKDKETAEWLGFLQNATGGVLGLFVSWLSTREIKTLSVRMDRHLENMVYLTDFLWEHDGVTKVYYPGFEDFPGYGIQKK